MRRCFIVAVVAFTGFGTTPNGRAVDAPHAVVPGLSATDRPDPGLKRASGTQTFTVLRAAEDTDHYCNGAMLAKQSAGNLPDGTAFLVNYPPGDASGVPWRSRSAVTAACLTAAFCCAARGPAGAAVSGKCKRPGFHYPKSLVADGYLHVIYATDKELVEFTPRALAGLAEIRARALSRRPPAGLYNLCRLRPETVIGGFSGARKRGTTIGGRVTAVVAGLRSVND